MLAIGVGGADAVDALTGTPWELRAPQVVGKSEFWPPFELNRVKTLWFKVFVSLDSSVGGLHRRTLSCISLED